MNEQLTSKQGIIWKTDRFATHDGPGIRTTLYFKGCPLRCRWCSNPEGQTAEPTVVMVETDCSGCGLCVTACPNQAIQLVPVPGRGITARVIRAKCDSCRACIPVCPTRALQMCGQRYTVPELVDILEKDRAIHRKSGGGLTCTGGDPVYQGEFLKDLLESCQKRGIHTAVETTACASEEIFTSVLPVVDYLFVDIKHMDPGKHQALTGVSNDIILRNIRLASSILQTRNKTLAVRMVIVPGLNDGQNVSDFGKFLCSLPMVSSVELLAYHNYGAHKYDLIGQSYSLSDLRPPGNKEMNEYRRLLADRRLPVVQV